MISVLDKGSVSLLNWMGSDLDIVKAARVSFSKTSVWGQKNPIGENVLQEKDAKLIKYLAEHGHWTPFGHCQVTLHFKMPIFVARQFMRSNVGICYNEVSRRYVDAAPEFYIPSETLWRKRPDGSVKQGSGESFSKSEGDLLFDIAGEALWACELAYTTLLQRGVAPEQARMVLPLNTYTEFWATMSLAAAARVYNLRCDPHAQKEIRDYADAMDKLIRLHFPVSWAALTESPR